MKYFLWIDEKKQGPYDVGQIREMLRRHEIALVTLGFAEDGKGTWSQIGSLPGVIYGAEPTVSGSASTPPESLAAADSSPTSPYRYVEKSGVASVLTCVSVLELIVAPIAGLILGSESAPVGWGVFASGVVSGLVLLGFARLVEHLYESVQRLRQIELLLERVQDVEKAM